MTTSNRCLLSVLVFVTISVFECVWSESVYAKPDSFSLDSITDGVETDIDLESTASIYINSDFVIFKKQFLDQYEIVSQYSSISLKKPKIVNTQDFEMFVNISVSPIGTVLFDKWFTPKWRGISTISKETQKFEFNQSISRKVDFLLDNFRREMSISLNSSIQIVSIQLPASSSEYGVVSLFYTNRRGLSTTRQCALLYFINNQKLDKYKEVLKVFPDDEFPRQQYISGDHVIDFMYASYPAFDIASVRISSFSGLTVEVFHNIETYERMNSLAGITVFGNPAVFFAGFLGEFYVVFDPAKLEFIKLPIISDN